MSNKWPSRFDPEFQRGRMAELERQRRIALILLAIGVVGLVLLCGVMVAIQALR